VSAILQEYSFEQVIDFAADNGMDCVEIMCWPKGKSERRYAGVTHIDVDTLDKDKAAYINDYLAKKGVIISALGYYPNPLDADLKQRSVFIEHIKKCIRGAALLGLKNFNTFIGKNLASSPHMWREIFGYIDSPNLGLNYDPSHLVWQRMDYIKPIYEFKDKIFHFHIKDAKFYQDRYNEVGIFAAPLDYQEPKLPGLGDVDWGKTISALTDIRYKGCAVIEVEDRAFEDTLEDRLYSILLSKRYMSQFI
jgi:sugar phosphate isomerase/epimerase